MTDNSDPLATLIAQGNPQKAIEMAAYHKAERRYLGLPNPAIDILVSDWKSRLDLAGRVALAKTLWHSDIHEARIAAAKLLTQARIRPDDAVWALFCTWITDFDAWAIADHACSVGARRLLADPSRIATVETWTTDPNKWVRRAALVTTLPYSKLNHPRASDRAIQERVLGWAGRYTLDKEWFIQKSVAWWLRSLSKHDPARVQVFLDEHASRMKPFARREAGKYL